MTIETLRTHSGSKASMNITEALALSPSNRLTPAERKALNKSDSKASKVLGITLTRNDVGHANQDRRLAVIPSVDQENAPVGDTFGNVMALISGKRARSRNASTVTIVGKFNALGLGTAVGMGLDFVQKQNKKRRVGAQYSQRVILGPWRSNEELTGEEQLSTAGSHDSTCSFLELDDDEETNTPLADKFPEENDAYVEDDRFGSPADESPDENDGDNEDDPFGSFAGGFVWDVEDPFNAPPNPALQRYFEAMRINEMIGPLDAVPFDLGPVAHVDSNFDVSYEEDHSALSCDDSFDDLLRPSEKAYLDFLIARDEAEDGPLEKRRERRAALRSRNKKLDVLGEEARIVVDGQH